MSYREFLKDLNSRGVFRIRPRLDQIKKVLSVLGNPQDQVPTIHIAGTNGKGSVAAALESVLRASGYRTGLYTSPHLTDLRERVQIDGKPLVRNFADIARRVLQAEKTVKSPLTYFELLTAVAFEAFRDQKVDIAIVECGLGGLWDATNIIKKPILSIITSIGFDHTEWLGGTLHKIAIQKAGIIRNSGRLISGVRGQEGRTITQIARKRKSKYVQIDTTFKAEMLTSSWRAGKQTIRFLYKGGKAEIVPFGLLGGHQVDNAGIVLSAVNELNSLGWSISAHDRDRGMRDVRWPGRIHLIWVDGKAPVLLDGAHNPPAMQKLLHTIQHSPYRNVPKTFVFSAFKDKDIATMGKMISQMAVQICLCPLPGTRAATIDRLRSAFQNFAGPLRTFQNSRAALQHALVETPRTGLVVVAGSLSLAGQILKMNLSEKSSVPVHA